MVKHNNVVPSGHFRKYWKNYVKTWFNQPARKTRRINARQKKVVTVFPRPVAGPLRPIVHGQTLKYNMKVRAGRGFSLEELNGARIPKKLARTIGISVDHRRRNHSLEGLQTNVQRLNTFKAKLVVFPRRARKFKEGYDTFCRGLWNYFSMGMDEQVSYAFHAERKLHPEKFKIQLVNQSTYAKLGCTQGWFFASLVHPSSMDIAQLCKVKIMKRHGDWEYL